MYYKDQESEDVVNLLLYVDDMLVISKRRLKLKQLKTPLNVEFEMYVLALLIGSLDWKSSRKGTGENCW